ncbi:hypothetical protein [Pseudomonas denitrificans (nom. rej.)]|uniref:Uncharacterized protein n=1 Tax=Pseudomonas denitrificans TaxID=43306 RepID=A0A9X7MW23_PSEDE|nr:hypothetical protein [Pseudomonas denitrificans (nom. rej.)]QEY70722.1 hypothetical protein F1C79_03125 [Pseudomonas denitrificans (nom. rej.)]
MSATKDLISLHLDKAAAQLRAESLEQNRTLRLELEELKASSARLLLEVQSQIGNAEAKLSERAIEKTLSILHHIKQWILAVGTFITLALALGAFLGYKNLTDSLTNTFVNKVDRWLRFEDGDSDESRALDAMRTQALLDAYMVRFARERLGGHNGSFSLTEAERQRLLVILQDPSSDAGQFSDALTIITRSRGLFAPPWMEDPIGKALARLVNDSSLSQHKRVLLLERLKFDRAFLPFSRTLVADVNNVWPTKMLAFDNLKLFEDPIALTFAQANVDKVDRVYRSKLALYIAQKTGSYAAVNEYAQFLRHKKPEWWQSDFLGLVGGLGEILPSTGELPLEDISALIGDSVLLGAGIRLTDLLGDRRLALELDGGYAALVEPGNWLNDPRVIGAIIRRKPLSPDWLAKVVSFFQVDDRGYELATLQLTLRDKDRLLTQQGAIGASDVRGQVWLRVETVPGGGGLARPGAMRIQGEYR